MRNAITRKSFLLNITRELITLDDDIIQIKIFTIDEIYTPMNKQNH